MLIPPLKRSPMSRVQITAIPKLKSHTLFLACLCMIMLTALSTGPAEAQNQSESAIRQKANAGTVTLITGGVDGVSNTYQQLASDLASVLDAKSELRVLPIIGYGSLQNVEDILYLKGIDVGMVHSDVMRHVEQRGILPNAKNRLKYVTKLYDEQLHVLANTKYTDINQLNGQTVIVGRPGSGNEMSALTLIQDLGLKVKLTHVEFDEGVEQVLDGRAAAMVVVTRKPSSRLRQIEVKSGLHFLPVPMTKTLLKTYDEDLLTTEDYPNLIPAGVSVGTPKVAAILAVFNWKEKNQRSTKIAKFIIAFVLELDKLKQASRKDVWEKLDITGSVKGWQQYPPAAAIVKKVIATRRAAAQVNIQPAATKEMNFGGFAEFVRQTTGKEHSHDDLMALYLAYRDWLQDSGGSSQ